MVIGDKVLYNKIEGTIVQIIDKDTAMVRLEDGQVYTLETSKLISVSNSTLNYTAKELKNIDVLKTFANSLMEAGVNSLKIKNGVIEEIDINETFEEKKARFVKKAVEEAEQKALEEFEKESKSKKDAKK